MPSSQITDPSICAPHLASRETRRTTSSSAWGRVIGRRQRTPHTELTTKTHSSSRFARSVHTRCWNVPGMRRLAAARRVCARVGKCRAAKSALICCERNAARGFELGDEGSRLGKRWRLSATLDRPIRAESVCRNAEQGRLVMAAKAVPVKRNSGLRSNEPHMLLAPIAMADNTSARRA